jgi:hypothetical protein
MPTYLYKCPKHGVMGIQKPMAEAGVLEYCGRCFTEAMDGPDPGDAYDFRGSKEPMRRVWSVPSLIVRPWGYHLRPDEPGYWNVNRAQEMGRIPEPDANSHLGAGAPSDEELEAEEYAGVAMAEPSPDQLQKLAEVARATFSESGSRL